MSAPVQTGARPTLLLLGGTQSAQAPLLARLGALFEVQCEPVYSDALPAVQRTAPEVVTVDLRADPQLGLGAMDKLHHAHADLPVVALSDQKDPDLILRAIHAGARDFVVTTDADAVARVFGELARQLRGGRPSGTIISLLPSKGGLGATTVAVNLAGALMEGKKRVVLVDLDPQLGDALVSLDLTSRFSISDVLANTHRLDGELLQTSLTRHASGLLVLSQPDLLGDAEELTAQDVTKLLAFLAQHFDYVVCDGLRRFDERTVAALDASNRVILLVAQAIPAIRNAHRTLEVFRRLGYGLNKVALVVSRYQKTDDISLQDITQHLGLGITGIISNDFRTVTAAVTKGQLLKDAAPRAKVTDDVRRLALSLSGTSQVPAPGGGFLKSLFKAREGGRHGSERAPQAG